MIYLATLIHSQSVKFIHSFVIRLSEFVKVLKISLPMRRQHPFIDDLSKLVRRCIMVRLYILLSSKFSACTISPTMLTRFTLLWHIMLMCDRWSLFTVSYSRSALEALADKILALLILSFSCFNRSLHIHSLAKERGLHFIDCAISRIKLKFKT